ncbi:hypothetical protein PTI98_005168 [Pleurotus ostreatus]|nr:hypothetical protein PTI98_005168 [Pleurotus ostreatus]
MSPPTNATQAKERLYGQLAASLARMSRAITQTTDLCEQLHADLNAMRTFAGLDAAKSVAQSYLYRRPSPRKYYFLDSWLFQRSSIQRKRKRKYPPKGVAKDDYRCHRRMAVATPCFRLFQ